VYRIILSSLLIGFFTISSADSVVQTDWSGGPGILGPVINWYTQFYSCENLQWDVIPGSIFPSQQLANEHVVVDSIWGACAVDTEDIDGDGDTDVLGASEVDDFIAWWENIDGVGTSWTEHIIIANFDQASSVDAVDVDGDGDIDALGASPAYDRIIWLENDDGSGTSWTMNIIDPTFNGACFVYSEDIDGDGDMDILGAARDADDITWWENVDGSGTSWTEHTVDGDFNGAWSVFSTDVNGDGYMDVLGAAAYADDITWWENVDGSGTSWMEHIVDGSFDRAVSVYSADVNGDGYMDVAGAAQFGDVIKWWENTDGSGLSWNSHTIADGFNGAFSVHMSDVDSDGDMDALGAAFLDNDITWWENVDGSGTSWTEHVINDEFEGAKFVCTDDIDDDDIIDVLGAATGRGISWWDDFDSYHPSSSLVSTIFDTQCDPVWDYLNWTAETPSGSSVAFQIRASDDYTNMGEWSAILTTPCALSGILSDSERFMQYKAILETSEPYSAPVLNDVTISWNQMGIEGTANHDITELLPFSPNPGSNPVVRFLLQEPSSVDISVFDLSGRPGREISINEYSEGYHEIPIYDLVPGVYFCRMISAGITSIQTFVVLE